MQKLERRDFIKICQDRKKVICTDIDGVLADFCGTFINFINEIKKTNHSVKDLKYWKIHKSLGMTEEEEKSLTKIFIERGGIKELPVIKYAMSCIKELSEIATIYAITSRQIELYRDTLFWIRKNFSYYITDVFFTERANKTKGEIASRLEALLVVEDNPEQAVEIANKEIIVLLFDYPYNREVNHRNIIRIYSGWEEATEIIKEIIKKED
jgi:uncharacterized HAD superfamily protein